MNTLLLLTGVVLGWHLRKRHERRVMLRQARQLADMVLREKRRMNPEAAWRRLVRRLVDRWLNWVQKMPPDGVPGWDI